MNNHLLHQKKTKVIDLTNEEVEHNDGKRDTIQSIQENQYVWVGKAQLTAMVLSVEKSTATVKYTLSNIVGVVDLESIEPMPFGDNSLIKRKRRQTNRSSLIRFVECVYCNVKYIHILCFKVLELVIYIIKTVCRAKCSLQRQDSDLIRAIHHCNPVMPESRKQ